VVLRYAVSSDPGLARERNEDCAAALPALGLFAIADGMGGHIAGEVASRVAIDALLESLEASPALDLDALARAMIRANRAVLDEASRRGLWGMGTTLTVAHVSAGTVEIAHIGDTRAYLLNGDRAELLTTDHTMVELLVRQGVLAREHARFHPERHVLVQALGTQEEILPELRSLDAPSGARLLLSSDGLHDAVAEPTLLELASAPDLSASAHALVRAANESGGLDNVTVVLVQL
jgi:protein phosphatase